MKRLAPKRQGITANVHEALQPVRLRREVDMALPAKPVRYYLKPGELFLGEEAAVVKTLLGSCVAVTMFSPRYHVGSVCHGVLPSCRNEHPCVGDCRDGPRYVDCAIRRMLEWFLTQGIARDEIVVKVFGGSDMYSTPEGNERKGVGKQNIDMALKTLEQEGLRLAASDVGGLRGRKVIFRIYSGEVFLKRLSSSEHKE